MNVLYYLLEANLYLAAFYLVYILLLRKLTHYTLNRVYLLGTSVLAFVIPFMELGMLKPKPQYDMGAANISVDPATYGAVFTGTTQQVEPVLTWHHYVLTAYAFVAFILLIKLIIKIGKLIALSKKGEASLAQGVVTIKLNDADIAFSFFNYLFINKQLAASKTIIEHEKVHIRQKHSCDIIYLELLKVTNWFNPFVYLLQHSLKEVHEFIADQHAADFENGTDNYASFLISNAYGICPTTLTNSFFNKNQLKNRITMLYQKKSGTAAKLKYLAAIPLLMGMLCVSTVAFSNKTYGYVIMVPMPVTSKAQPTGLKHPQAKTIAHNLQPHQDDTTKASESNEVLTRVEKSPYFPGGEQAFATFLHNNIKYPQTARDNKVGGRVFVSFIVEKDGHLSDIKILRDPGSGLGNEAVRVLKLSPAWHPGVQNGKPVRVSYTVPINFSLSNDATTLPPPPRAAMPVANGVITTLPTPPKTAMPVTNGVITTLPTPPHAAMPATNGVITTLPTPPRAATPIVNGNNLFTAVEIQPQFKGGEQAFAKFLSENIKYPKLAKDNKVTGRAYISFVVEKDGSLSDVKVIRDPGSGLGDEAARVIKLSPNWTPGIQNGRTVRVQYTVPINFSLPGQ